MEEVELMKQKLHENGKALEMEKLLNQELTEEIEKVRIQLSETKTVLDSLRDAQGNEKRSYEKQMEGLIADIEADKLIYSDKISNLEKLVKAANSEKPVVTDSSEYDKLTAEIAQHKQINTELEEKLEGMKYEKESIQLLYNNIEQKCKDMTKLYDETKVAFDVKKEELSESLSMLKELKEENGLLSSQLAMVHAKPADIGAQENSLFKEVEDKRKKYASSYNDLKQKYLVIKKCMNEKNRSIKLFQEENSRVLRNWKGIEQSLGCSKGKYMESLKSRIQELETLVFKLEKRKESPEILTLSAQDLSQLQCVHIIVGEARNEARETIEQYQKISSASLIKAAELRRAEIEISAMKVAINQKEDAVKQLELKLDELQEKESNECEDRYESRNESLIPTNKYDKTVRFADDILEETTCMQSAPKE